MNSTVGCTHAVSTRGHSMRCVRTAIVVHHISCGPTNAGTPIPSRDSAGVVRGPVAKPDRIVHHERSANKLNYGQQVRGK